MTLSRKIAPKLLLMILIITAAFLMSTIVSRADDSEIPSESPAVTQAVDNESNTQAQASEVPSNSTAVAAAPVATEVSEAQPAPAEKTVTEDSSAGNTPADSQATESAGDAEPGSALPDESQGTDAGASELTGDNTESATEGSAEENPGEATEGSLAENPGEPVEGTEGTLEGIPGEGLESEVAEIPEMGEKQTEEVEETAAANKANMSIGWHTVNKEVRYYYSSTKYYTNKVVKINGKLYGFNANGAKLTNGVYKVDGKYYHFNASGVVTTTVGFVTNGSSKHYVKSTSGVLAEKEIITVNKKSYCFSTTSKLIRNQVFTLNGVYRSADANGVINKEVGFTTVNGKEYYVKNTSGVLAKSEILTVDGHKFGFGSNAVLYTKQVFKLNGTYRFANEAGIIRTTTGFFTTGGKKYYVKSTSGALACNQVLRVNGKSYAVGSTARLLAGAVKVGNTYYFCNSNYTINTSAGWHSRSGKKYFAKSDGTLYYNRVISVKGKKYYMGSNAAVRIGTFTVNYVKYTTDKNGVIKSQKKVTMKGIDVSYAQGNINWAKVKAAGIDFAFIRVGYRASASGSLEEDSWFRTNMIGAKKAGIKVGVYFFSVATTAAEAKAEANFTANLVKSTGYKLDLPMVIDSETCPFNTSRAKKYNNLSASARTTVVKAFLDRTKELGYTPMVYASTSWLDNKLIMSKLSGYQVWVAQYNDRCTYGGKYSCWQYTSSGYVNGISGRVDMNIWYN